MTRLSLSNICISGVKVVFEKVESPKINASPNLKFMEICQQRLRDIIKLYYDFSSNRGITYIYIPIHLLLHNQYMYVIINKLCYV